MNFTAALESGARIIPVHLNLKLIPKDRSLVNLLRLTGKGRGVDFRDHLLDSIPVLDEMPDHMKLFRLQSSSSLQDVEDSLVRKSLKLAHPSILAFFNLLHPEFSTKHLNATQWKKDKEDKEDKEDKDKRWKVLSFIGNSYHLNDISVSSWPANTFIGAVNA